MRVTAAIGDQPAGGAVTEPPVSDRQATSTSPEAVPAGWATVRVVAAVDVTSVLTDSRLIPAGGGGGGASVAVIVPVAGADAPPALEATRRTVYVPAAANVWLGDCAVDVVPSPKSHDHDVGAPVDVSVNWTASGAVPLVGVAEKLATGGPGAGAVTAIVVVAGADAPPALEATRRTV